MSEFDEYPHFFEVQLDLFQGPIDLLLHLVKIKELPLESVSLAQVTEQYLACLEQMRRFDLEIAGEYLVIAATLVSIKSSLILNEPAELIEDDEGNLVDPHEELLRQLREAEVYKKGAHRLESLGQYGIDVFSNPSQLGSVKAPEPGYRDHDPILLGLAFQRVLKQVGNEQESFYTITLESVSIVERMMGVLDQLKASGEALSFEALIPDLTSRGSVIGTFVALLELCKRQVIGVRQDEDGDEILIALSENTHEMDLIGMDMSSEFDAPAVASNEAVGA